MKSFTLLFAMLLLAPAFPGIHAQDTKAIVGATLIDGTGRAPIKDAVILIEGERIKAVGPSGSTRVPEGAQVIDAGGKFVIPGLADMHNHLYSDSLGLTEGPPDFKKILMRILGCGFTLVFDPASRSLESFSEFKRASAEADTPYPRYFGVYRTFGAEGGHGPQSKFTPETPDEARAAVRQLKATGTDAVKIYHTNLIYVTKQVRPMLKSDVLRAIIEEAHRQGLKTYTHSPVLEHAKEALRAGVDGLAHGILSDPVDDEFIALMKRNGAVYVSTHAVFESVADVAGWTRRAADMDVRKLVPRQIYELGTDPNNTKRWEAKWNNLAYMKDRLPTLRANLRKVYDAGIPVVLGSDSAGGFVGLASQIELALQAESGLTPQEVLQTATINAARMIGREKDLGSIEPGKLADMVVLDADPLADIRNVRFVHRVIKGGRIYDPAELFQRAK
ncbi:MAG TPA: amidohydrolase family protein [Blastocatellia bacterium]|nr:amidohydrolase family protein [Blastocatellia bacterium]